MDSMKQYNLAGVASEVQLGKKGAKIDGASSTEQISLRGVTGDLVNAEVADGILAQHAVTKAQLTDAAAGIVQLDSYRVNYDDNTVSLGTFSAGTRIFNITVANGPGNWVGVGSESDIKVGTNAEPAKFFSNYDFETQTVSEVDYILNEDTEFFVTVEGEYAGGIADITVMYAGVSEYEAPIQVPVSRIAVFARVAFTAAEEIVVIGNPQFGDNDNMDSFGRRIDVNLDYAVVSANDNVPSEKQGLVSVYEADDGTLVRHIPDPSGNDRSYKQFGQGLYLDENFISVGYNVQWSEAAYYIDVSTGDVVHELLRSSVPGSTESDFFACATAMSSDHIYVGARGGSGYIAVFDRETGAYVKRIENTEDTTGFGSNIQIDEPGNILITRSDSDNCIHLLDLTTYENIYVINVGGGTTSSSVFVYDGLLYVGVPQGYGGDGYVGVYDYVAGELVNTISSPSEHYGMEDFGLSVSASGRTLFVLDGYRPYDQDGVLRFEHGAIFGLNIDDNYSQALMWQDPDWSPVGDHIKVYGDKMILGSPAYADDDGDYVSGKIRIFSLSSLG